MTGSRGEVAPPRAFADAADVPATQHLGVPQPYRTPPEENPMTTGLQPYRDPGDQTGYHGAIA